MQNLEFCKSKLAIIIQARMGSTRLPEKMIMPFYGDLTILDCLIQRIKETVDNIPIVLATTKNINDDRIEDIGINNNIFVYRGSEEDVLLRFIEAANMIKADSIIRICADNPFLSMNFLKILIKNIESKSIDYLSFCTSNGVPTIKTHYGLWTEFVKLDALNKIQELTDDMKYHEHVTNYIYDHSDKFNLKLIPIDINIEKKEFRLTVDTEEDFFLSKKLYKKLIDLNLTIEPESFIHLLDEQTLGIMKKQISKNSK